MRAGDCGGRLGWNRGSYNTEDALVLSDPIGSSSELVCEAKGGIRI